MLITLQTSTVVDGEPMELSTRLALDAKTRVELPVYFVEVGPRLAIKPLITVDGKNALRIDLSRWIPTHLGPTPHTLPVAIEKDLAIDAGVSFDLDPATQWTDPDDAKLIWLCDWADRRGLSNTGGAADPTT